MSPPPPPIDVAEFNAHRNISSIIVQFLCRNKDKGFSAKEIAESLGIREEDVNNTMVKLGLTDLLNGLIGGIFPRKYDFTNRRPLAKIEDIIVNGVTYYRCLETRS